MAATQVEVIEAYDIDTAVSVDDQRRVRIELHKDAKHDKWTFRFNSVTKVNGGHKMRPSRPILLQKGKAIEVDIKRARAWLGWFTIPHDITGEMDTRKVKEMEEFFSLERVRTLNAFGDYPRPRKVADGSDPTGPHRMPDFTVTVIEGDGERWDTIRLHELYGIGKFDSLTFTDPQAEILAELDQARNLNAMLQKQLAEMAGQIKGIGEMVRINAGGAA